MLVITAGSVLCVNISQVVREVLSVRRFIVDVGFLGIDFVEGPDMLGTVPPFVCELGCKGRPRRLS